MVAPCGPVEERLSEENDLGRHLYRIMAESLERKYTSLLVNLLAN